MSEQGLWQVNKDLMLNCELDIEQRLRNMECDMVRTSCLIEGLCTQCEKESARREKYDTFLDHLIQKAEFEEKFWREAKMKIVVSGIWACLALIASACVFTLREWLHK